MTGISSSKGKLFRNFDSYKNQEWLRRRKLRIEQVRQQSNKIAKALRQKVENEEKLKNLAFTIAEEQKFKNWRSEKLDEMEKKLRFALEEFGLGHRLIENEPDPKEILETRNEFNKWKAQERGDIATQEELKKKKLEKDKKMSPIERKKMTRKLEDLRSALVCSLRTQKLLTEFGDNFEIPEPMKNLENTEKKTTITKRRIKLNQTQNLPPVNIKKVTVKKKNFGNSEKENFPQACEEKSNVHYADIKTKSFPNKNKIWIDLNDVQTSSAADSNVKSQESKTTVSVINSNAGKTDKSVEFYDYNSRYLCKTYREYPNLVEKIQTDVMAQDSDAAYNEKVMSHMNERKKEEADFISKERGNKALKKEKINREFNNLINKLNDLHKKEKIIKATQHVPSNFVYMNDDRILEKTRNRQRIMNSRFENLCFEVITTENDQNAEIDLPHNISWNADDVDSNEKETTPKSFSPSNLKANSPATSGDFLEENTTLSKAAVARLKNKKKRVKRNLVAHIDKTLKEGRELRKSMVSRIQSKSSLSSEFQESENEIPNAKPDLASPIKKVKKTSKTFKNQISQTEDFQQKNCSCLDKEKVKQSVADDGTHAENDSLLVSTATSYKSPPCEIQSSKLVEFFQLTDLLSKMEGDQKHTNLKRRAEEALLEVLGEMQPIKSKEQMSFLENSRSPTLRDYIVKLLNMSRKNVANLSVSADSTPTPDFENHSKSIKSESSCSCLTNVEFQQPNDKIELEKLSESIQKWEEVLEDVANCEESADNVPQTEIEECSSEYLSDYNKITEKCEKRIEELSSLLEKVRKEKEKLLLPSESSSLNNFHYPLNSEHFFHSNSLSNKDKLSEDAICDSRSSADFSDEHSATETFPDVLEELLEKKILTSPFEWYKKSFSTRRSLPPDFSSIEAITHNFRNQMSKIKPSTYDSRDLPSFDGSNEELCYSG